MSLHSGQVHAQGTASSASASTSATNTSAPSVTAAPTNVAPNTSTASAATTADPATRVMAREFATRGAEAFDRGAFAEALDDFNRAAALLDAPTIALMQARSLVKLGRWLEGLDRYQQMARYTLNPTDPAPYHDAIQQASAEGEALRQQLPQLSLLIDPVVQDQIVVELDGQLLPSLLLNTSRPIDPGIHKLKASKGGAAFLERSVETPPGEHVEIQLSLPVARAVVVAPAPKDIPAAPPPEVEGSPNWPLIGVATIGGLGAVGAVLTTVLGSSAKAQLDDKCTSKDNCPPGQRGNLHTLETARTLFYVSSALFVIGGGLTTYLLVTADDNNGAQTSLSLAPFGAQLTTTF